MNYEANGKTYMFVQVDEDGACCSNCDFYGDDECITVDCSGGYFIEGKSDDKLAEAAPDLLAALQALYNTGYFIESVVDTDHDLQLKRNARAAIAKATEDV